MTRSVDMRTPASADLAELDLKGIDSKTKIPNETDEIGILGTDTDDLLSGVTPPRPARVSNIRTNDGCSDMTKIAMQMGVAQEDLFVELASSPAAVRRNKDTSRAPQAGFRLRVQRVGKPIPHCSNEPQLQHGRYVRGVQLQQRQTANLLLQVNRELQEDRRHSPKRRAQEDRPEVD